MNKTLSVPFEINREEIKTYLRITAGSRYEAQIEKMFDDAGKIARPKALYRVSYIENRDRDTVTIDQYEFRSQALRANLETVGRVFPYIATCGTEVGSTPFDRDDVMQKYWLSTIQLSLLRTAIQYLRETIQEQYQIETLSAMNPGSGEADVWPIEQQPILFSLLGGQGEIENAVGVRLMESCLMTPEMSVSGILFPSETAYYNCQLCQRENCPGRQAHFDPELWKNLQTKD